MLDAEVRFVVMGVWGANYYARASGLIFNTKDRDLFLAPDVRNLVNAWQCCDEEKCRLFCGDEPLDIPRDDLVARRIVEFRAVTTAFTVEGIQVDLSLTMAGFQFDDIWRRQRAFVVEGMNVPVAHLADIVASKAKAGRDKDRLFLATHEDALRQMQMMWKE